MSLDQIILNSDVMTCSHDKMTVNLIYLLSELKRVSALPTEVTPTIKLMVDTISERCKKENFKDTYKLFILNKVKVAYDAAKLVESVDFDQTEEVLDIPIEEFEDAYTDHEFLKLVGYNE